MKNFLCEKRSKTIFRNKCCILCLVLLVIFLAAFIAGKIFIDAVLQHIEEDSFNSTSLSGVINNDEGTTDAYNSEETGKIPSDITSEVPHTLSGYDFENRPVWIIPFGSWDIKGILNRDEENDGLLKAYMDLQAKRVIQSIQRKNVTQFVLIVDMDQYSYGQLFSAKTVAFEFQLVKRYNELFDTMAYAFGVNLDTFGNSLITLATPLFGKLLEKFQMNGKNKEKYIPSILKKIPADQLPPEYGGSKGYKPVQLFN